MWPPRASAPLSFALVSQPPPQPPVSPAPPAHPPQTPPKLPWRQALLWALLAIALATAHSAVTSRQIAPASDLWDYSQQARQVARGEGFTSLYSYPTLVGPDERPPYPVRWRMPLYSWRGAQFLHTGVPLPDGFFLVTIFAHALLVALVFLLGTHLHSTRAGGIAAAAAAACPLLLDSYNPGLSQLPVAAVGTLVWLLLLRGRGLATAAAAALLAAVTWYARAEVALFAPIWIAAAWRGGRPVLRAATFGVAMAALCAPWPLVLQKIAGAAAPITGNPMLLYTPQYPGYASSRTYLEPIPGFLSYLLAHPATFAIRWAKDFLGYGLDLVAGLGPIAPGLALAGLLLRAPEGRYRELAPTRLFWVAIAIQIAAFAALQRSPRFLVPIVPLACVMAGIAAAPALGRICGRRMVVALFLLLVGERAATVAFETRSAARRYPPLPAALAEALREHVGAWSRGALLLTDIPDWSAWHLDRPAMLLPTSRTMGRFLADHPAAAILLSPDARARNVADGDSVWIEVWDRVEPIAGFRGPITLPGGARLYERTETDVP